MDYEQSPAGKRGERFCDQWPYQWFIPVVEHVGKKVNVKTCGKRTIKHIARQNGHPLGAAASGDALARDSVHRLFLQHSRAQPRVMRDQRASVNARTAGNV